MARYDFKCDCGCEREVVALMKDSDNPVTCECGQQMQKCISLPSTDLVNNVRYSNAMGVNPRRIAEMERKYPGSRYDQKGRLEITSRKDKLHKIRERGLVEFE